MKAKSPRKARPGLRGRPKVAVVGFGRLGGALALGLRKSGWPVTVLPRSDESVRRASLLKLELGGAPALREADVVLLAVPDSVVGRVSAKLRTELAPNAALVHCAGALDLSAFGTDPDMLRRRRGSFHPLCAVSDPLDDLSGHAVAIAASEPSVTKVLERMAAALKMRPIQVPEARRSAYHAGAVMAAGLVVALLSAAAAALEEAGIPEEDALEALLPLTRSAVRGLEQRGPSRGLTGPIARGDVEVVRQHLSALPADLAAVYRALSLRALKLVGSQLPAETRHALERTLRA